MKNQHYLIRIIVLLLITSNTVFAQTFNELYHKNGMYFFDRTDKIMRNDIFTTHKAEFGLGDDDEMVLEHEQIIENGKFRASYRQYHKGVKVETGLMNIAGMQGVVLTANGSVLKGLDIDDSYTVSEESARVTALDFFGASSYPWDDAECADNYREVMDDPDAVLDLPQGNLIIVKMRADSLKDTVTNYKRCWHFHVPGNAVDSISTKDIYVDAATNVVYTVDEVYKHSTHVGSVTTPYNGTHGNIITHKPAIGTNFSLKDDTHNIETFKQSSSSSGGLKLDIIKDGNNNWVESATRTAASAHWAVARAFDYFNSMHGYASMDGAWGYNQVRTNVPGWELPPQSAGYTRDPRFGLVDVIGLAPDVPWQSMAILDILSHEYTHGIIEHTSRFGVNKFDYEAASLNEAFCDIFGHMAETFTQGSPDWEVGEDLFGAKRSLYDPYNDAGGSHTPGGRSADYYHHPTLWMYTGSNGLYTNGGVMRKWFHILSAGGTIWNPVTSVPTTYSGLGIHQTAKIAFNGMRWWFWHNLTYEQAAQQLVNHVVTDYGWCSKEHKLTARILRTLGFTNIASFNCADDLEILGSRVVDVRGGMTPQLFKVKQNNDEDDDAGQELAGTYLWTLPAGWSGIQAGDSLVVDSVVNYNSQKLFVKFTSSDSTVVKEDSVVIHFSDENFVPNDTNGNNVYRSIEEQSDAQNLYLDIFPNPAHDQLRVNINSLGGDPTLYLYDLMGKQILSRPLSNYSNQINISEIPDGNYIIRLEQYSNRAIDKLIIMH